MNKTTTMLLAATAIGLASAPALAQKVLSVGMAAQDVQQMDPHRMTTTQDRPMASWMFNGLMRSKPGTISLDDLEPDLAESYEVSADRLTWTFKLRRGVQFHRGFGELTADDVVFSIRRAGDSKTSAFASDFAAVDKVEAVDSHTVRITLKNRVPFLLGSLLNYQGGFIVSKKAVEQFGDNFKLNPVGTGPFVWHGYEPKQKVILRANDKHWDGKPKIDQLEVMYLPETAARTLAFVKGDVDMIEGATVPGWRTSVARQHPSIVFDTGRPGSIWAFHLNMTRKPLDDLRVRKAIAHAIDQRAWTAAFGDFVSPTYGIAPYGYYGSLGPEDVPKDADWPFVYNPEKSKKLLAEAGMPNGFAIDVFVTEREEYKSNVLIIQEQLRKVGIQINMRVVEHTSYHNDIRKDLNSMIMYSSGQPPLTQAVLNAFYKSSAIVGKPTRNMNFSHYGDIGGNSDELMQRANEEVDNDKRLAMLKQVQIEIMRQVPSIPLPSPAGNWMHNGKTLEIGFPVKAYMGTFTLGKASRL